MHLWWDLEISTELLSTTVHQFLTCSTRENTRLRYKHQRNAQPLCMTCSLQGRYFSPIVLEATFDQKDCEEVVTGSWGKSVGVFWGYRLGCTLWPKSRLHQWLECVTDCINIFVGNTIPTTVRCFHIDKPWITSDLKELHKEEKKCLQGCTRGIIEVHSTTV